MVMRVSDWIRCTVHKHSDKQCSIIFSIFEGIHHHSHPLWPLCMYQTLLLLWLLPHDEADPSSSYSLWYEVYLNGDFLITSTNLNMMFLHILVINKMLTVISSIWVIENSQQCHYISVYGIVFSVQWLVITQLQNVLVTWTHWEWKTQKECLIITDVHWIFYAEPQRFAFKKLHKWFVNIL